MKGELPPEPKFYPTLEDAQNHKYDTIEYIVVNSDVRTVRWSEVQTKLDEKQKQLDTMAAENKRLYELIASMDETNKQLIKRLKDYQQENKE